MTDQDYQYISVRLAANALEATLQVQRAAARETVTEEVVLAKAVAASLIAGPPLVLGIKGALEAFASHDLNTSGDFVATLIKGRPAEDGQDATFVLEPDLGAIFAQSKRRTQPQTGDEARATTDGSFDHYARTTLMVVRTGQRIGRLNSATDGTDGFDVCGHTLHAKPGRSVTLKFDPQTIDCAQDGVVVAKVAGQLIIQNDSVLISPRLSIEGYVDYSTGNIDFPGSIEVRKGIRDCFQVSAGRSITVEGLVEAAELSSARDIQLLGGISGRGKGSVYAGRDLRARYLNRSHCRVGRDLIVDKEICECVVAVSGSVVSPSVTVMGGELASLGACDIAQAGSEGGTHTVISLGRADTLEAIVAQSLAIIKKVGDKAGAARAQLHELQNTAERSAQQVDLMTSLQFEISEADAKTAHLREALRATLGLIESRSVTVLRVQELLCQGTEIRAGGIKALLTRSVKGPLTVSLNASGEMICTDQRTGSVTPMKDLARLSADETSYNRGDLPSEFRKAA